MASEVIRAPGLGEDPAEARAEAVALALMGVGTLAPGLLAEAATWDRAEGALSGRAAILAALAGATPAARIRIEQVVAHGAAGSVTGRITRGSETRLFGHVIRFTNAAATQIAQLVSFEHAGGRQT